MPENDVKRNSWLCQYAICQIGKPYWYATSGQISTTKLYVDVVQPHYEYSDYMDQLNVKVHDCSGLVGGALTCESVGAEPTLPNPLNNQYTMFWTDCDVRSQTMSDFPYIPGTLVFHTDDVGNKTHVGIYVGDFTDLSGKTYSDTIVEAMGHDYGVVTSSRSSDRWDSWGQLNCCTIDTDKGMVFDARSASVATQSQITINVEATTPFVATLIPQFNSDIDYQKIKDARISAMAFFGGELYDESHIKRTYVNPYLERLVQQCNDNGMPYMLYVNVRARDEIEADAECRTLYYVLAKFPPKLGVWLCIKTNNFKETNDKILEVYYKYIEKWGLKDKCGFYVSEAELSKFTWTTFQDRFYLWLISSMDVTKVDDELLQPEMFEVAD